MPLIGTEQCTSLTKSGKTCRSGAVKGTGLCFSHTPGGLAGQAAAGGTTKRKLNPKLLLRDQFEELREELTGLNGDAIRALTEALVADRALVVGNGPQARVETAPDHAVRLSAAKELWDRLYGRPAQTTRLEAGGGGVLLAAVLPPDDPGHTAEVQELLERATGDHATPRPARSRRRSTSASCH
jgi:hypothetical protein